MKKLKQKVTALLSMNINNHRLKLSCEIAIYINLWFYWEAAQFENVIEQVCSRIS